MVEVRMNYWRWLISCGFFVLLCASPAQTALGNEPYKPDREARLKALVPVIKGLYEVNTVPYANNKFIGGKMVADFYTLPKTIPSDGAILQSLKDTAEIIDFGQKRRIVGRWKPHDFFPYAPTGQRYKNAWPDTIAIYREPGTRGCFGECRQLLYERYFKSIIIVETKGEPREVKPIKATRYFRSDEPCVAIEDDIGYHANSDRDETINLYWNNDNGPSSLPGLGLCLGHETVSIPEHGIKIFMNSASPFLPKEFIGTQSKMELIPDKYRVMHRIIFPKAFPDLETNVHLTEVNHIGYEINIPEGLTNSGILFESACFTIAPQLPQSALEILIKTDEPTYHPYALELTSPSNGKICYGDTKNIGNLFLTNEERKSLHLSLAFTQGEMLANLHRTLNSAKNNDGSNQDKYWEALKSALWHLRNKDTIADEAFLIKLAPFYFEIAKSGNVHHANTAVSALKSYPKNSLSGHLSELNEVVAFITDQAECGDGNCESKYTRSSRCGPSVCIRSPDQWGNIVGDLAGIYAATGEGAVHALDDAYEQGIGGADYAGSCIGAMGPRVEADLYLKVQTKRNTGTNPYIYNEWLLATKATSKPEYGRKIIADLIIERDMSSANKTGNWQWERRGLLDYKRFWLFWDSDEVYCKYRDQ